MEFEKSMFCVVSVMSVVLTDQCSCSVNVVKIMSDMPCPVNSWVTKFSNPNSLSVHGSVHRCCNVRIFRSLFVFSPVCALSIDFLVLEFKEIYSNHDGHHKGDRC